jgi:hypothetical protein
MANLRGSCSTIRRVNDNEPPNHPKDGTEGTPNPYSSPSLGFFPRSMSRSRESMRKP